MEGEKCDFTSLLKYFDAREQSRREEEAQTRREEAEARRLQEAETRRQEAEIRKQEFQALIQALTLSTGTPVTPAPNAHSDLDPSSLHSSTQPARPPAAQIKAVIQPPAPLQRDTTYQAFREWRRRFQDYSTMTDLEGMDLKKQYVQLRLSLSNEVVHILRYRLRLPQDDSTPINDVLDKLDSHFRAQTNEALRRRDLFSCKQEVGEPFNDFFVRVKTLAEAVEICKGCNDECEQTQLKHVLLMGLRDEELVEDLISIIPTKTLDEVVAQCYAHEAARHTATAISSNSQTVRATSKYKKEKAQVKSKPPPTGACHHCNKAHDKGNCPATNATCRNCGRKGHWPRTPRCPAAEAKCNSCGKVGHYDRCCRAKQDKQYNGTSAKGGHKPGDKGKTTSGNATSARRVHTGSRAPLETSPPVVVTVSHGKGSGALSMIPDTGADATIIGPSHLPSIGVTIEDLTPPPQAPRYTADGTEMKQALGSVYVQLTLKGLQTGEWIDVHSGTPAPLLSYRACRELAIIPERFPQPIQEVTHAARVCTSTGEQDSTADTKGDVAGGDHDGAARTDRRAAADGTAVDDVTVPKATAPPRPTSSLPPASPPHASSPRTSPPPFTAATTPAEARRYFLQEFADVLVRKEDLLTSPLRPMTGPPMRIHLREDAQPFAVHTPRQIPLAYQDAVRQELDSMEAQGIIAPVDDVPSPWCHPLVAVPKPQGGVRITTDLSKLNSQVSRPAHPSPTPFAAIRSVTPEARFFTAVDALHGYWQLELAEEDQHLTTFITPYGRYKYRRGPMGFAATGDAFCRRGDAALQGITNCVKVVDDVLIYDEELLPHLHRVHQVLARCRANGITLNADKFALATPAVKFCGFVLSAAGIAADPEKVRAIAEFPTPANITDLRSFMGLVNQLAEFSPDISAAAQPLRPLLSPRRTFTWTADHDAAFQRLKTSLAGPPVLAMFDPNLPTILQTDASRLYGIGYVLLQEHGGGKLRLVQCGSRFLTDAETRYATIELEMLATVWAMHKCGYYLKGLQTFEHVTDHRPLIPILNHYTLDAVENPRLQRLKEKLSPFVFTARWRAGKQLCIPDALSRHPVSCPTDDDDMLADVSVQAAVTVRAVHSLATAEEQPTDMQLEDLQQAARADETYVRLLECVRHGFPRHRYDLHNSLLDYWKLREELYCDGDLVLYGPRVVVPAALRKSVLQRLHDGHRGAEATKRRAQQTVFWPGVSADITNVVRGCAACQTLLPSQQKEAYKNDDHPTRPFESVSADHFSAAGKTFLVIADRLSGWPVVFQCGSDTTAHATIQRFNAYFADKGTPVRLRTDGGPPFTSREFQNFLQRWNVRHDVTSPHHAQSNGHAEASVKAIKHLILKVAPDGNIQSEAFLRGLLEVRNTPNYTGRSPAQMIYGHPLRTRIPAHPAAYQPEWQPDPEECDRRAAQRDQKAQSRYNSSAGQLPLLPIHQRVRIQDPVTKRWYRTGTVVAQPRPRQYEVQLPNGRILKRNRLHLRPVPAAEGATIEDHPAPADGATSQDPPTPRRSQRLQRRQQHAATTT